MSRRVTATLRDPDEDNLATVEKETKLSPNDAIRQALATEAFIQTTLGGGGKVLVQDKDGKIREVAFLR